ncbi:MAG: hypothetical protein IKS04_01155, partial [Clostridia bacterium]|nr:hypothetical protein [Clostridia bacterium]
KEGYEGEWSKYTIAASDITVNAEYTAIEYKAVFTADGKTVAEVPYTVETKSIEAPAVPEKEGYTGEWEEYKLAVGGITVNAVYTENEEPVDDNLCKWCGKEHDNSFFGRLTKFFHNILLLLRWLFGNIDIRITVNM